jgi:hypothetical protein
MPPWNELVLYEMHVGTFNAPAGSDRPGTFATAVERLRHLADLGVNAIELMPVAEFEGGLPGGGGAPKIGLAGPKGRRSARFGGPSRRGSCNQGREGGRHRTVAPAGANF